jgi:hypothetical protein
MDNKFNKFFIASLKRTAMNVSPLIRKKQKLEETINAKLAEIEAINKQIEVFDTPVKDMTGGFGIEDLITRVVETNVDKEGKEIKVTKWVLKYPDTVVPPAEDTNFEPSVNNNEGTSYNENEISLN